MIPTEKYDLGEIADIPNCVWFIDNFGNIKTDLLRKDCDVSGRTVTLKIEGSERKFNFYEHLKDLPNKEMGLTVGSSGIGNYRFLEIMIRGGNAAKELGITEGSLIEAV
jgi:S-adenosylmethionine hydrolase